MTAANRREVEELFQAAADLARTERTAFLAQKCADPAMRSEVERLLRHFDEAEGKFLATPAIEGIESAEALLSRAVTAASLPTPAAIGRYRVVRKIGEGGMGAVFEAEQDHPRRRVALKVIRVALGSQSLLHRFQREVEILGQLKHSGIAQIYDAGTYDDGSGSTPYFAMEYVDGQPLTEFARERRLSTRARLTLMGDICDAVQHAHQKGVVHRDLKPANILVEEVEGEARPKILDFGVARAVHADAQLLTAHTEAGQLLGTLSYMSPEQVSGRPEAVDTRSDVYTLGVILYELLAERFPYDLRNQSFAAASSAIREQEPSRLSSVNASFRGDVETIVAKALAKEKDRRYQSAAELGHDIRRFLRDEPIVARPTSRAYQLRKFAKRNKAIVGGVAATFAVLVLGIIATGVALVRARDAERMALERSAESQRSAAKAAAVNGFLQEMLASVDPANALGREVTIRQALDEAAAKITAGALKDQPEVEAELRTTIGTTYQSLGHYPEAESHLRAALDIRKAALGEMHFDTATSLQSLALLLDAQGRHEEAISLFRGTLQILERLRLEDGPDAASTMQSLGASLRRTNRLAEAEGYYKKSLAARRRLFGEEDLSVAQSLNSLALLNQSKGNYAEAEKLFRQALDMRRKLLGEPHPLVADALNNLANLLWVARKPEEGLALMQQSLEMRRKLLSPEHPALAQSLNNVGQFLYDQGDYETAERMLREALAIWRKTLPEGHADIGSAAATLGIILSTRKDFAAAEPFLREGYGIFQRTWPADDWHQFNLASALGYTLAALGQFEEAEPLLVNSYEKIRVSRDFPLDRKKAAQDRVVYLYEKWNRPEQASHWREMGPQPDG